MYILTWNDLKERRDLCLKGLSMGEFVAVPCDFYTVTTSGTSLTLERLSTKEALV